MRYEVDLWRPFSTMRDFGSLQRSINRMFDEMVESNGGRSTTQALTFAPASDIEETENEFRLSLDLPGVKKEDIKVDVVGTRISVSGERHDERTEKTENRRFVERTYGKFERSFELPNDIDPEKVEAHYDKGVLYLTVPKAEASKPKQIPIKEGASQIWNKLGFKKEKAQNSVDVTKHAM